MLSRIRKVFRSGRSTVISLPRDWLETNQLGPGDAVVIEYDDAHVIVRPEEKAL